MCTSYNSTSCSTNYGVVCGTDFIPFVRSFRYIFLDYILTRCNAQNLNRSWWWPKAKILIKYYRIFAIEGRAWVEAKKDGYSNAGMAWYKTRQMHAAVFYIGGWPRANPPKIDTRKIDYNSVKTLPSHVATGLAVPWPGQKWCHQARLIPVLNYGGVFGGLGESAPQASAG